MAVVFTVVGDIVFAGRYRFQVPGVVAHHPSNEAACQLRNQEGVFTVALGGTSPAGIPCRLNNGGPVGEGEYQFIVESSGFICNH